MIPFHSLGTENGIMEAVTIEGMYILKEGQPLYLEKPVLGLAEERLFRDDGCGGSHQQKVVYRLLFSSEIFQDFFCNP